MSAPGTAATTRGKIVSPEAARSWRQRLAAPLVFTNGVFDLLHPGHVDYLEAARSLGGHLIVGVNTDRSARTLGKGGARPILDQAARARVLAGLASVDRVVLFDEPTPLELITALAPDVLVKGGDYTRESIVGASAVEAKGGRVVVIPLTAGYSTTDLVERCRAAT
jgi:rfaE bifunctional protein nucleotidyltransferase chain/domain